MKIILFMFLYASATTSTIAEAKFPARSIISTDGSWAIALNSAEGEIESFTYIEKPNIQKTLIPEGAFAEYSGFKIEKSKDSILIYAPGSVWGEKNNHSINGIYLINFSKGGNYTVSLYSEFSQFIKKAKTINVSTLDNNLPTTPLNEWLHILLGKSEKYIFEWEVEHCDLKPTNPVCVQLHIRYKDRAKNVSGFDIVLNLEVGTFESGVKITPNIWSIRASKVKNYKWYNKITLQSLEELSWYIKGEKPKNT